MKDCLKKIYFLTISVFLFHCSMNMEDKVLLDKEQIIDSNFSLSLLMKRVIAAQLKQGVSI